MASISVGDFPKVLSVALRELLEEQDLVHSNINSNKNVTSVVLRFAMPGQYNHTPVTWRTSPSYTQYRRDRQRFTNYVTVQNNSHQGTHFDSHQYNGNMDIVNENSAHVCEYSTNNQFHLNDNAIINPSLNCIHVGQMSCGDQVVNAMSEMC